MQADAAHSGNKRHRLIKRGPIPHDGTVLIASKNQPLVIEANEATDALTVLGLTSPRPAYPLGGTYGEELGSLTITYESGRVQTVSLQNGVHITTVFATNGSSRINPIAERAPRFAEFGYDKNFEIYVMNRLEIPTDSKDKILTVRLTASTEILIYGIFTNFKKKEVNL